MSKSRRSNVPTPRSPKHARRAPAPRTPRENDAEWACAAGSAGVPIEQLMREVAQFRVALEADMTIAAAAAELGEGALAFQIVESERGHLADFEARALETLEGPARVDGPTVRRSVASRVPRTWLAAAAAIALITGLGTTISRTDPQQPSRSTTLALAAAANYADFARLASGSASASQMIAAASKLHDTLARLVLNDPTSATQVASILNSEQDALLRWLPAGTGVVLADAKALVARLSKSAPGRAGQVIGQVKIENAPSGAERGSSKPAAHPTPQPTSGPTAQPAPTTQPQASPSTKPTPRPTSKPSDSPKPTPTPSGSPSPSRSPVIPGGPAGLPTI